MVRVGALAGLDLPEADPEPLGAELAAEPRALRAEAVDLGAARRTRARRGSPRHPSRCTVSGAKAGRQTATYSAPSGSGEV